MPISSKLISQLVCSVKALWGIMACLSHCIDGRLTHFTRQVVSFSHANAMLAGDGTFHLDGTLGHAVDHVLCNFAFLVVVENDGYWMSAADHRDV